MKESPIKYIEIYFGQINCYLMNIENELNYIDKNKVEIEIPKIISKFSNLHIKYNYDKVKATNELRDIFVKNLDERNQYKILIDEKIELFQTNLTKVENKLNEIYRFGLTLIEMDLFYIKQFIDEVKLKLKNQENKETTITNPFNEKTAELFEYIVKHWNYDKQQKWADIWIEINELVNYKAPYQNEYQTYIIKRFEYTGRFQYDKAKDPQNRNRIELINLIKKFSKK
jgi:lipopolysaccharide export LptBFGC system permease protein LptF